MQTMSQSFPKITAENTRSINLGLNLNYPDFASSDNHKLQSPPPQNRIQKNLDSNSDHTTESNCLLQRNGYSIHLVNSFKQRIKASTLIKRMYASRGYQTENTSVFSATPYQYTFETRNGQQLLGTLTLIIDSDDGLLADQLYKPEIDFFRKTGKKVCEISKLAFNPNSSSKEIFASLFHIAYLYAHFIHGVEHGFIEINPRHASFYKRMLGFQKIGERRICQRVNAAAVLLHLDLDHMKNQILSAAKPDKHKEKSLYPYFLTATEEEKIKLCYCCPIN